MYRDKHVKKRELNLKSTKEIICKNCNGVYIYAKKQESKIFCYKCLRKLSQRIIINEERYVALIDILGYKKLIANYGDNIAFIFVLEKIFENFMIDKYKKYFIDKEKIDIEIISDSIIISLPIDEYSLLSMILGLAVVQYYLMLNGISIRGGISRGNFKKTKNHIFSNALINAYNIQYKSEFPLVHIPIELVKICKDEIIAMNKQEKDIIKDADKYLFRMYRNEKNEEIFLISYLDIISLPDTKFSNKTNILKSRKAIENYYSLFKETTDSSIKKKLSWLVKHFNDFVKDYNNRNKTQYRLINTNDIKSIICLNNYFEYFDCYFE